jgi:small subunit ribosomal protein S16
MLKIRLTRVGKKNSPAYRVVVAEQKRAVQRKFIEILGHYNPIMKPKQLVIDKERALFWISQGAQPSDTVTNLMCTLGYLPKENRVKKTLVKSIAVEKTEEESAPEKAEEPVVEAAEEVVETTEEAPVAEEVVEAPAETTETVISEEKAE